MSPVGYTRKHRSKPVIYMTIGVSFMVGFILMEFLMVLDVLPNNSFAPHLIGYGLSVGGMFLAIIGFVIDYKDKIRPK